MLNDVYYGAFAAYFISLCVASRRLADFLRSGPFPWLGNVSFSLYLIHWPIICATIIVLLDRITLPAALFVSFPLTLLAAAFMERWVERPSHELGKRLSAKIERVRRRSDQSATIEA
jgi:peptidoglycan/LPS O-acetylase OafA/YrhL